MLESGAGVRLLSFEETLRVKVRSIVRAFFPLVNPRLVQK